MDAGVAVQRGLLVHGRRRRRRDVDNLAPGAVSYQGISKGSEQRVELLFCVSSVIPSEGPCYYGKKLCNTPALGA